MSTTERIPLARPPLAPEAEEAVLSVLRSGALVRGSWVEGLERELSGWLEGQRVLALGSGTAALEVGLAALEVGEGDEVVMPDFTFPSLASAIAHLGARPVTVDISLDTYNADAGALLEAVGPKTKAVVPVHQFGLPMDVTPLVAAGAAQGFAVVEDAACAFGARLPSGRPCGTEGTLGCFSFHPRKPLTTGEGGAVTTGDAALFAKVAMLANHGMDPTRGFDRFVAAGWNYRMSNVHAALAAGQLWRLEAGIARRRAMAADYVARLASLTGVTTPAGLRDPAHTFQSFVVLLDEGVDRAAVLGGLAERGVESTIGSYAVHSQPFFREALHGRAPEGGHPRSRAAFERALALPLFETMTEEQQDRVVAALGESVAAASR